MWPTALMSLIGSVIERLFPDPEKAAEAKMKLIEMQQNGQLAELDADVKVMLGQLEVNKAEAATGSLFIGGWRPAIGWTCAVSLFSYYVPYCLIATALWAVQVYQTGFMLPRPDLGIADLLGLVGSMLGMAGLRTKERLEGKIPPQS